MQMPDEEPGVGPGRLHVGELRDVVEGNGPLMYGGNGVWAKAMDTKLAAMAARVVDVRAMSSSAVKV